MDKSDPKKHWRQFGQAGILYIVGKRLVFQRARLYRSKDTPQVVNPSLVAPSK